MDSIQQKLGIEAIESFALLKSSNIKVDVEKIYQAFKNRLITAVLYVANLKIVGKLNNLISTKGNVMPIKILHNKYFKLKENKQGYGSILPKFALGKRTGNMIETISSFSSCRETLGSQLRHKIAADAVNTRILRLLLWFTIPDAVMVWKDGKLINVNRSNEKNYLEYVSARDDESIYGALHVLNTVEKELKWRKTTIRKVDHRLGDRHCLYLITASPKWMFSPPLLSLYTLILRAGTFKRADAFKNVSKVKSISKLATAYAKITDKYVIGQSADIVFLKEVAPTLEKFLINISKIYKGRSQKVNFDKRTMAPDHRAFDEGITKLIKGTTGDELILKRFLEYTHK